MWIRLLTPEEAAFLRSSESYSSGFCCGGLRGPRYGFERGRAPAGLPAFEAWPPAPRGLPDVRGVFSAQVAAVSQAALPAREAQAVLAAGLSVGGNGWRGIRSCWV